MGTVTAIEQVEQIRRELRELDLKNSPCPVDRRRAEKEAAEQAQKAHAAQEQNTRAHWLALIDQKIEEYVKRHVVNYRDEENPGPLIKAIAEHSVINRREDRNWVKEQIEDERQSVDAKLAELEQRLKSVPGKLPVAKSWRDESVTYMAEFVSHKGSL